MAEEFVYLKDESEAKIRETAGQLLALGAENGVFSPRIYYRCGEGPLGKNVATILHESDVELVVIGNSTDTMMDHLIFGSDTMDVVNHSSCPILIIPPKSKITHLKKVTLAIAYELADINAINYMIALAKTLHFKLEIVHILVSEERDDYKGTSRK